MTLLEAHANSVSFVCVEGEDGDYPAIGTTFLVGLADHLRYFVTARHVLEGHDQTFIRLRKVDGSGFHHHRVTAWQPHDTADVAATPCDLDTRTLYAPYNADTMFTDRWQHNSLIHLGEQCYFVGLLSDVTALKRREIPMMRAGNVGAWFQTELPINWPYSGLHHEPIGHLVDTFSRGGFSGSPVFVEQLRAVQVEPGELTIDKLAIGSNVALLGLIAGHYHSENGDNAGLAIVVPIEFVRNLLDYPSLVEWREQKEEQVSDKKKRDEAEGAATADSVEAVATQFEKFEALTKQLVNTPKPKKDDGEA